MVGGRTRILALLVAGVAVLGGCSSLGGEPGGIGRRGRRWNWLYGRRRRGRGEPPDPGYRGGQVQRRDGPHRAARRRRLEPGPLRGPAVRLRERRQTPTSPTSRTSPRARTPSRSSAASPEGLQLHHRHVVRLHGPDGDRRRGVPGHHVPPPDRLQVERQELRQLLRRDGGLQVPRRHARRVAREDGRQPEDRLHGDIPDPRGAPARQRDHARRQGDLPRVHDGHPVHQHLA